MTIEVAVLISIVSVAFGIYQGATNMKRTQRVDNKSEATQLTTVIVKLENIGDGISEIKNDLKNVKNDLKDDHDRLIKVEESTKSAHKRMDICEKYWGRK